MTIFGTENAKPARLFLPKATATWSLEGLFDGSNNSNAILYSIGMADVESLDIRRCFNETNHIFSFGRDVSKTIMTVSVMVLLGKPCDGSGDVTLDSIRGKYEKARVSKAKDSKMIQFDDTTAHGFLISMNISGIDPRTSSFIAQFSYILDLDN